MGQQDEPKAADTRLDDKDEAPEADERVEAEEVYVEPQDVFMHSLPLLSSVDHHTRLKSKAGNRVVGALLGHNVNGKIHCTNSFAVPFEENVKSGIWFFDNHYLEDMLAMFKKVNTKEAVVGWYSTGPKLTCNDMGIHDLFRRYCPHPIYMMVRVSEDAADDRMPCTAYKAVEEIENVTSGPKMTFVHLRTTLKCSPMEEVGVVHLLRDIQDYTVTSLATQVKEKVNALKAIGVRLAEIKKYLDQVAEGKLPMNHNIMYTVQDIFNTLPSIHSIRSSTGMATEINDQTMLTYLGSMLRSIVALHSLILNKEEMVRLKEEEEAAAKKKKEKEEQEKKEKEEKEEQEKKEKEEKKGKEEEMEDA